MKDSEFDHYLALITSVMKLSKKQRYRISAELRDHLQERRDELIAHGINREDAIKAAIEELGDASILANDFSQINKQKRKRFIMQGSFNTVVAASLVLLITMSILPERKDLVTPPTIEAQTLQTLKAPVTTNIGEAGKQAADKQTAEQYVEAQLAKGIDVRFEELGVADTIDFLRNTLKINIHANWATLLNNAGIEKDVPINLHLKNIPAAKILDLVLQQANALSGELEPIAWMQDDGIINISTVADLQTQVKTKIYKISEFTLPVAMFETEETSSERTRRPVRNTHSVASASDFSAQAAEDLMTLIAENVGKFDGWGRNGGATSSMRLFRSDMLIVKTHAENHRQLVRLLKALSAANKAKHGDVVSLN